MPPGLIEITVTAPETGLRVDRMLAQRYQERSRAFIQHLLEVGRVRLNGAVARKSALVATGQVVIVDWPDETPAVVERETLALPVLFEDDDLLVINKPAGMAVHPGLGHRTGTVVNALLGRDYDRYAGMMDEYLRPGIVHRLDIDTSGVLVIARHAQAKMKLGEAFRARQVDKRYLALVYAAPEPPAGCINVSIGRHPLNRKSMAVRPVGGKTAVTHYRTLVRGAGVTLIGCRIETGRTHQIRVHMNFIGHPVIGDGMYGGRRARSLTVPRQLLHAWRLALPHPRTGAIASFAAPWPDDMRTVMAKVGIEERDAVDAAERWVRSEPPHFEPVLAAPDDEDDVEVESEDDAGDAKGAPAPAGRRRA